MAVQRRERSGEDNGQSLFSRVRNVPGDSLWKRPSSVFREFQVPSMDVSETDEDYEIQLEVPGIAPDDIDVSYSGQTLTVQGQKKKEREEGDEERDYHRVERQFGSFSRQIRVPQEAKPEEIQANYDRGILRITVPKTEEAKRKKIDVNVR